MEVTDDEPRHTKPHLSILHVEQPVVGDGDAVGIAANVIQDLLGSREGRLTRGTPPTSIGGVTFHHHGDSPADAIPIAQRPAAVSSNTFLAHRRGDEISPLSGRLGAASPR